MRIRVRLVGGGLRRWHLELLERLASRVDTVVQVEVDREAAFAASGADRLFQAEIWLHGLPHHGLSDRISTSELTRFQRGASVPPDVVLDLRGGASPRDDNALWVTYDGVPGDAALIAAILGRRAPIAEVQSVAGVVAVGRLGTEFGGIARATLDDMLARTSTLILGALDSGPARALSGLPEEAPLPATAATGGQPAISAMIVKQVARKLVRGAYQRGFNSPHWRVGWRQFEGPDVVALRGHPNTGWTDIPDDGTRFYADPFPIAHRAKVTLFVEDFEHRRGKGVISAVEMGPKGPIGVPQLVLEQPGHLSYPFVFERDGSFWMIPETSSAGKVDLFRATDFPGGWKFEATLVANVVASDATLVEHEGLWWLFATVRDGGGAYSDALHLWSAPDFRGPWTAHPRNPVLIDIASARPAGRFIARNGVLYRPVQDCRNGYGAALGIARVDRLDTDGFSQTVETILRSGPQWPGRRLHTLNSAGGFEFIDGSALAPRWKAWRRGRSG